MFIDKMKISEIKLIKNNLKSDYDDFWSKEALEQELLNENRIYILAKNENTNEVLGFAGISIIFNEAELMNIVVKKNKRKHGIGKALLEKIINICIENNIEVVKLEVNENNISAKNLYKSCGFIQTGKRERYYNNKDAAILFDLKINI